MCVSLLHKCHINNCHNTFSLGVDFQGDPGGTFATSTPKLNDQISSIYVSLEQHNQYELELPRTLLSLLHSSGGEGLDRLFHQTQLASISSLLLAS